MRDLQRWPACSWAFAFCLVHVYWLFGGHIGLPADVTITPWSPIFIAALVAVPLLSTAGLLALIGGAESSSISPAAARVFIAIVFVFCFLHACWPLTNAILAIVTLQPLACSEKELFGLIYEMNWFIGGVCFFMAFRAVGRRKVES